MPASLRLMDRLKKASRLDPVRKEVELDSGEIVVMWVTPLTAAERDRAKKDARSDDPVSFALQLLIRKAKDDAGTPLFNPGDIPALRNEIRDSDLQKLLMAVIGSEEETEAVDTKSGDQGTEG